MNAQDHRYAITVRYSPYKISGVNWSCPKKENMCAIGWSSRAVQKCNK